ncbi:hypothetical protein D3C76_1463690 [compost metagenome]
MQRINFGFDTVYSQARGNDVQVRPACGFDGISRIVTLAHIIREEGVFGMNMQIRNIAMIKRRGGLRICGVNQ